MVPDGVGVGLGLELELGLESIELVGQRLKVELEPRLVELVLFESSEPFESFELEPELSSFGTGVVVWIRVVVVGIRVTIVGIGVIIIGIRIVIVGIVIGIIVTITRRLGRSGTGRRHSWCANCGCSNDSVRRVEGTFGFVGPVAVAGVSRRKTDEENPLPSR